MDGWDSLRERVEALECQTYTLARQLRWWRGLGCGFLLLGLLSWALSSGTAQDALEQRVSALQDKLAAVTFDATTNEVIISGANLRLINGLGDTNTTNGLGNLIVGYNEPRDDGKDTRTGSHNVVVGRAHTFSSFGGLVVGFGHQISGGFAAVSGGRDNTASGTGASVSGGCFNTASGEDAAVSGGINNTASGLASSVSGGFGNTASGDPSDPFFVAAASVSGGVNNMANGSIALTAFGAAVSGGTRNTASGAGAAVSGGFGNTASGADAAISGGSGNTASEFTTAVSGDFAAVSGGSDRSAPGEFDWAAGSLFENF
jgi:hypothetical protein